MASSGAKLKRTLTALNTHPSFGKKQIERLTREWDQFEREEGAQIDNILRENDKKQHDSFVNEIWTNMYLRN